MQLCDVFESDSAQVVADKLRARTAELLASGDADPALVAGHLGVIVGIDAGNEAADRDALFALTLSAGLQADYAALIEKRNMSSLHYTKEASYWAQQLLAVCSDCYDVHVATGFSKYIIGSMAAPVRWMLRLGGLSGDKQAGLADLQLTAERGHYLAPFARILLAIAYVREKDRSHALQLLTGLRTEFPGNPLYGREIARLETGH